MKKSNERLAGTDDIMKEINKDGGRYLPVWAKPEPVKPKRRLKKNAKSRK